MYQQNQVVNKPTAAYILSLLGGIIGLLVGIAFLAFGAFAFIALGEYSGYYGFYDYDYLGAFGFGWTILLGIGAWMLITSILIIVFARKLNAEPLLHSKYGAIILVLSIIGVGGILGLIGGILALVYKPQFAGAAPQYAPQYAPPPQGVYAPPPQQQYQQQIAHNCPQCGTMVQPGVRFCPNCGRQQY